jgi:hypothetical protein
VAQLIRRATLKRVKNAGIVEAIGETRPHYRGD